MATPSGCSDDYSSKGASQVEAVEEGKSLQKRVGFEGQAWALHSCGKVTTCNTTACVMYVCN